MSELTEDISARVFTCYVRFTILVTIPEFTKERFLSRVAKARALVPLRKKFALIYFLYIFSSTYRCTLFLTFLRSHLFALSVHMFIVYVY